MVVAERETVIEFKVQSSQSMRRSTNFMRRCAQPETVHKFHANPSREAHKAWANPHNPIRGCAEPEKSRIVQNTNNNNNSFVSNYYPYFCPRNKHRPAPRLTSSFFYPALAAPRLASPFVYPVLAAPRPARHLLHCILSCQRISVQTVAFCRDYFLGISEKYIFSMSIFGVFVFWRPGVFFWVNNN